MTEPTDTNQASEVLQGDCLELMKGIPDGSVDMILADLPYGTTACKWDTIIPFEPLWEHYKRIIKPNGAIVLTASQPFTSALVMSNPKMFKYCWYWKKSRPTGFLNAKKQPLRNVEEICIFYQNQSIYNPQMKKVEEKIFTRTKGGGTYGKQNNIPSGVSNNGLENPFTLLEFSSEHSKFHPTQKPVALFEYLIKTYTNEGDLVLDNVAGSGTTGVACQNTGRNFILMEQEPEYVEIIKKRLKLNKEEPND